MNVAKSAPFALLTIYPKIHVSPQSSLKPPILANHAKLADHFPIRPVENDIPNSTANAAKSAPFTHYW